MSGSIPRFMLADLSADELAQEMIRRIPATAPEWKNVQQGDPGRAIIDLVAWMGETILYRVNLLPRRQRLEFLRLLGLKLRPAAAAQGLVALAHKRPAGAAPVFTAEGTRVSGPVAFETRGPVTVQPFEGRLYYKRSILGAEKEALREVIDDLAELYRVAVPDPYATTELFETGRAVPAGIDPFAAATDRSVWIALLALDAGAPARQAALDAFDAQPAYLNIGVIPRMVTPDPEPGELPPVPLEHFEWSISSLTPVGSELRESYLPLQVEADTTRQMTVEGTLRLLLPGAASVSAPANDIDVDTDAGLGAKPPRVDDPDVSQRIVGWIRLRPKDADGMLPLSWMGINAVAIEARETRRLIQAGVSNGRPAQVMPLPDTDIDPESFVLSVQEGGKGFVRWFATADLGSAARDARVFTLDAAAGTVAFGDGLTGKLPEAGARVRVDFMRSGGGAEGNVAAATLAAIEKPGLAARQPAAMSGGRAAETLEQAEKRVTAWLQHNDRCVTEADYKAVALDLDLARVEVLPRFRPYNLTENVPGVVSVLALPGKAAIEAPNPRPDRRLVERVRNHLEPRRPLGTELFVIAPDYVKMGAAVAVSVRDGFAPEEVAKAVRAALYQFLWPLAGGGRDGAGWPLGQAVSNLEVELIAARVPGVLSSAGASVFSYGPAGFAPVAKDIASGAQLIGLERWQLPECLQIDVAIGAAAAPGAMEDRTGLDGTGGEGTAVPVVPEVC